MRSCLAPASMLTDPLAGLDLPEAIRRKVARASQSGEILARVGDLA